MNRASFRRCLAILAIVLLPAASEAAGSEKVQVAVKPPTALDILLVQGPDVKTLLAQTGPDGRATIDGSKFANLPRLQVYAENCDASMRVLLVLPNVAINSGNRCTQRRIGSYWWEHDDELKVQIEKAPILTMPRIVILG